MTPATSGALKNILFIDDDPDDCYLFTDAIKTSFPAINLKCANSYDEAAVYLRTTLPDLIFLDLNIPSKNGYECLTELKADDAFRNIPVIIFSSSNYSKDIKLSYEKGAALYLTKPISYEELLLSLHQIFQMTWSRPAAITAAYYKNGRYQAFQVQNASL